MKDRKKELERAYRERRNRATEAELAKIRDNMAQIYLALFGELK